MASGFFLMTVNYEAISFDCDLRGCMDALSKVSGRRNCIMTIEEMKNVDVRTVDRDSLVDVTQIVIDESLSKEERVAEYLRQVKNPYCFRVGKMVVKNIYSNDGVSLEERFEQFARTL